jgi:protein gp37
MAKSKIEWTEYSWNPVSGCTPISEGCQNCYAKRMSKRLAGRCGYPADDPFRVTLHPERLDEPLKWKKPRRVFVCSMGDLFHEDVPEIEIMRVFAVMADAQQHTYLVLTKRPERMKEVLTSPSIANDVWLMTNIGISEEKPIWPLPNVWLGVTAENQARADERIPILLQIPAAVRFVSIEPMLGPVDLTRIGGDWYGNGRINALKGLQNDDTYVHEYNLRWKAKHCGELDWVICGSESGPNHRKTKIEWIRDLREQCISANVPFFLKQMEINGRMVKMPELDGKIWAQFPEVKP